jgi:hypothetical protein
MTTENHPLHRIADRSYTVLSSVGELRRLFDLLGFKYEGAGDATALWQHRWYHIGPGGKTVLVLFKPHPPGAPPRLSLLGPRVDAVDSLCDVTVETTDDGGTWLAFGKAVR